MIGKIANYFFSLPSPEVLEKHRSLRLLLAWFLCFLILIRALVLTHFLSELDFSEINPVKLTQYIFAQMAVLLFVIYLTNMVWRRPHKLGLFSLFVLCIFSVIRSQDIISVASAAVVFVCVVLLLRGLYLTASAPVEEKLETA